MNGIAGKQVAVRTREKNDNQGGANIFRQAFDCRQLDGLFQDLASGAVRLIRAAAEEMRERENWRAS